MTNHKMPTGRSTLQELIQANIEVVSRIHESVEKSRTWSDILADAIANFCGSMVFVWVHMVWFGSWLLLNASSPVPRSFRWDGPPFPMLTLVVSLEAIFLSTFILISQNRSQLLAEKRSNLDLQINLLAEQETSHLMARIQQICERLDIADESGEGQALSEETNIEEVVKSLDAELKLDPMTKDSRS
jgi:uncharacterized membrane protein